MNKQLGASLDTRHNPSTCQKKQLSVNVIDAIENETDPVDEV